MPDNVGPMFYHAEVPWHRKGLHVPHPLNLEEALQAGDLDWEVEKCPIQTEEVPASPTDKMVSVVRSDTEKGHPICMTVRSGWTMDG